MREALAVCPLCLEHTDGGGWEPLLLLWGVLRPCPEVAAPVPPPPLAALSAPPLAVLSTRRRDGGGVGRSPPRVPHRRL